MPVLYPTKQFKDISLSFKKHPVTKDILVLKDNDAIKKSVMNIVRSSIGDRFYESSLGSRINDLLFSLDSDEYHQSLLKSEINTALQNWEPRVKVLKVNTSITVNRIEVTIEYEIIGQPDIPQEIQFVLEN